MSIDNFTELKTAVANWLHRTDLTSRIPEFIELAEAKINRQVRHRSMVATVTLNPSTTVTTLALPAGWTEFISFVDDLGDELEAVTFDELENIAYGRTSSRPYYYAVSDQIYFDTTADQTYNYKARYYKRLDIANDTTNDVLTNHPDIYLYGTLMEAMPFTKNDKRVMLWVELYKAAVADCNRQNARSRRTLRTDFGGRPFNIIRGY